MQNYSAGIIFKLLNLSAFCVMSLLLVEATRDMSLFLAFILANFGAAVVLLPLNYVRNKTFLLFDGYKSYTFRALFNIMGLLSWITGIKYLGPNEATAITFCIPMFTVLLATLFCGEKLTLVKTSALFISFIGAVVIIAPKLEYKVTLIGLGYTLFSSACWAAHDIICKLQASRDDFINQGFKNFIYSGVLCLPLLPYCLGENGISITSSQFFWLSAVSVTCAINVMFLFLAYKYSKITNLMPLSYLRLVFMGILVYILHGTVMSANTIFGTLIIAGANFSLFFWEKRQQRLRKLNRLY